MGPPPIMRVSTAVAARPPPTTSDETARLDVTAERCGARVREKCLPIIAFYWRIIWPGIPGERTPNAPHLCRDMVCLSPLLGWVGGQKKIVKRPLVGGWTVSIYCMPFFPLHHSKKYSPHNESSHDILQPRNTVFCTRGHRPPRRTTCRAILPDASFAAAGGVGGGGILPPGEGQTPQL